MTSSQRKCTLSDRLGERFEVGIRSVQDSPLVKKICYYFETISKRIEFQYQNCKIMNYKSFIPSPFSLLIHQTKQIYILRHSLTLHCFIDGSRNKLLVNVRVSTVPVVNCLYWCRLAHHKPIKHLVH